MFFMIQGSVFTFVGNNIFVYTHVHWINIMFRGVLNITLFNKPDFSFLITTSLWTSGTLRGIVFCLNSMQQAGGWTWQAGGFIPSEVSLSTPSLLSMRLLIWLKAFHLHLYKHIAHYHLADGDLSLLEIKKWLVRMEITGGKNLLLTIDELKLWALKNTLKLWLMIINYHEFIM